MEKEVAVEAAERLWLSRNIAIACARHTALCCVFENNPKQKPTVSI
jgi:hypothetical protein